MINNFAEAMENDVYPENSVLVLENCFFLEKETGLHLTEEHNMQKFDYDYRSSFISEIE